MVSSIAEDQQEVNVSGNRNSVSLYEAPSSLSILESSSSNLFHTTQLMQGSLSCTYVAAGLFCGIEASSLREMTAHLQSHINNATGRSNTARV